MKKVEREAEENAEDLWLHADLDFTKFWSEYAGYLPIHYELAQIIASFPVTSVPVERLFSVMCLLFFFRK